jgi:hypothetical protein
MLTIRGISYRPRVGRAEPGRTARPSERVGVRVRGRRAAYDLYCRAGVQTLDCAAADVAAAVPIPQFKWITKWMVLA